MKGSSEISSELQMVPNFPMSSLIIRVSPPPPSEEMTLTFGLDATGEETMELKADSKGSP
uniref:Uncharacterized protein n=1 Tax=Rhizophora mucronata TaxID=61149 RepID=A0A2P2M267_RHIMU